MTRFLEYISLDPLNRDAPGIGSEMATIKDGRYLRSYTYT